jgi:hypothetical protein
MSAATLGGARTAAERRRFTGPYTTHQEEERSQVMDQKKKSQSTSTRKEVEMVKSNSTTIESQWTATMAAEDRATRDDA